jgi:aspartate beta-hydroxylase/beta-hydroxylase
MDIDATYPSLRKLDAHFSEIRQELIALLPDKDQIPRYHELDEGQTEISAETPADWKVFMLYAMGEKPERNRARCPRTSALLDEIPGLFQAFFSILDPGKHVPAHCGPYRGYIRYHLALKVPEENKPCIRIRDKYHTWIEGESILFDDSWDHEVRNDSQEIRVVLIVDVLRPMPWPFSLLNRTVTAIIRLLYAKGVTRKLAAFR